MNGQSRLSINRIEELGIDISMIEIVDEELDRIGSENG